MWDCLTLPHAKKWNGFKIINSYTEVKKANLTVWNIT
jgi:hypothetical protein